MVGRYCSTEVAKKVCPRLCESNPSPRRLWSQGWVHATYRTHFLVYRCMYQGDLLIYILVALCWCLERSCRNSRNPRKMSSSKLHCKRFCRRWANLHSFTATNRDGARMYIQLSKFIAKRLREYRVTVAAAASFTKHKREKYALHSIAWEHSMSHRKWKIRWMAGTALFHFLCDILCPHMAHTVCMLHFSSHFDDP